MTFGLRQPQTSVCSLVKGLSPLSGVVAGICFHVRLRVFRSGCCHYRPPSPTSYLVMGPDPPCSPLSRVSVCSLWLCVFALWWPRPCGPTQAEARLYMRQFLSSGPGLTDRGRLTCSCLPLSGSRIHRQTFTGHLGAPKRWALAADSLHRGT